jgi:Fe-S-cluster-containing hydrogenase component 2
MRKIVVSAPQRCSGCRTCELACSLRMTGAFRAAVSGIRRHTLTGDLAFVPISCLHCSEPHCRDVCPVGAITQDDSGVVTVDRSRCMGCLLCVLACPAGALSFDGSRIAKCDMCGGNPECVTWCPREALSVVDVADLPARRGKDLARLIVTEARAR